MVDAASARPPSVLVVDDEPDLQELISFEFTLRGFKALAAGSGREALAIATSEPVDAVVTDIRMPGGDGVELLGKLKDLNFSTPVVLFITAFADLTAEEAYHRGAEGIFTKPFDRKALVNTVRRSLQPEEERWKPQPGASPGPIPLHLELPAYDEAVKSGQFRLGRGGFFVALDHDLPHSGESLDLRIHFADGRSIEGTGIARWVRNGGTPSGVIHGCGVEFQSLSDSCRTRLIAMIHEAKMRPFIPKG